MKGPTSTRPSLPPLLWASCCVWAGVVVGEHLVWNAVPPFACLALLAVAVACGLIVYRRWHRPGVMATVVCCSLACGIVLGLVFWGRVQTSSRQVPATRPGEMRVEVVSDPVTTAFGTSVELRVTRGGVAGALVDARWPGSARSPENGRAYIIRGSLAVSDARDDFARQAFRAGQCASARIWKVASAGDARGPRGWIAPVRSALLERVRDIPGEGGALLQGVLLGERSRVRGTPLEEDFRTTGLSHILSVSGTHLSIVATIVGMALSRLKLRRATRTALVLAGGATYVLLTGVPTSSVRAFVMIVVGGLAGSANRRSDGLSGLGAAILCVLAWDPSQAFDVGFALSVLAVGGLLGLGGLARDWVVAGAPRVARGLAGTLATSLTAQVATLPVAVPAFHMVSFVSPVANALVIPPTTLALGLGVLGACVGAISGPASTAMLRVAALVLGASTWLVHQLARVPHAAAPIGGGAMGWAFVTGAGVATLWAMWPKPPSRTVVRWSAAVLTALALLLALRPLPGGAPTLTCLDVGQGDAILLRDGTHAVLVDCGPTPGTLREALARTRTSSLECVLLTHAHADHTGGLAGLSGVVTVGVVAAPQATLGSFRSSEPVAKRLTGAAPRGLRAGQTLQVGKWRLTVLWPGDDVAGLSTNDTSLMLLAECGSFRAVLTGDGEEAPQDRLAAAGSLVRCDVIKVPHHGSSGGLSDRALAIWRAPVALVSVGEGNRFGHPHASTLEVLARAGARVYRTDLSGDVGVLIAEHGYRVRETRRPVARSPGPAVLRTAAYATIGEPGRRAPAFIAEARTGDHGSSRPIGPQVRLPHIRGRGPPARSGGREAQAPSCRGRGPRIQPTAFRR